ncbi:MAG: hypothetical protein WCV62_00710 [Candidatus Peribacteraceae bacterium]|jgi:hypothetical protein
MPILNPDTASDYEAPDVRRIHAVSTVEKQVWDAIDSQVQSTRGRLWKVVHPLQAQKLHREEKDMRKEVRREARENPRELPQTAVEATVIRTTTDELELRKHPREIFWPSSIKVKGKGERKNQAGTTTLVDIEIEFRVQDSDVLQKENSANSIKEKVTDRDYWTKNGIRVDPMVESIKENEAQRIAEIFIEKKKIYEGNNSDVLRKAFEANGVNAANVRTALEITKNIPEAAIQELSSKAKEIDNKMADAKDKFDIVQLIEDVGNLPHNKPELDAKDIDTEEQTLSQDEKTVHNLVAVKNRQNEYELRPGQALSEWLKSVYGSQSTWSADDVKNMKNKIRDRQVEIRKMVIQYKKLANQLDRIYDFLKTDHPGILANFIENGKVDWNKFKATDDPKVIAASLLKDAGLSSKEEYNTQIVKLREEKKNQKTKTGKEAVLAVYAKYFELEQKLSPDQARKAAEELYGRNALGRQEIRLQKYMVGESRKVLPDKSQSWFEEEWRALKGFATGSQEDFLCHIAESPVLALPESGRRLWVLHRKWGARPPWGMIAHDYPRLVTAYFAIREAERQGYLRNTGYIRDQLNEVSRLLLSRHTENMVRDFDRSDASDEKKREEERRRELELSVDDTARTRQQIRLFLAGDVPSTYAGDVNGAISYAVSQTAWKRRAVGRGIQRAGGWTIGNGAAYNPVTWPGKAVRGTYNLGKRGVNKARAGFGKAWNYLFHQKGRII